MVAKESSPAATFLTMVRCHLHVATVLVIPISNGPLRRRLEVTMGGLMIYRPRQVISTNCSLRVVDVPNHSGGFSICLFHRISRRLNGHLLFVVAIPSRITSRVGVFTFFQCNQGIRYLPYWDEANGVHFQVQHVFLLANEDTTPGDKSYRRDQWNLWVVSSVRRILLFWARDSRLYFRHQQVMGSAVCRGPIYQGMKGRINVYSTVDTYRCQEAKFSVRVPSFVVCVFNRDSFIGNGIFRRQILRVVFDDSGTVRVRCSKIMVLVFMIVANPYVNSATFLFVCGVAFLTAKDVGVVVSRELITVALFQIIQILRTQDRNARLTVCRRIIRGVHRRVLFDVCAAALLAITAPANVSSYVVMNLGLDLTTHFTLT